MGHYIRAETHMYVVSGSRQRMISEIDERGSGMSPSITHGDLAPDMMSSTKLNTVSVKRRKLCLAHTHKTILISHDHQTISNILFVFFQVSDEV